MSETNFYPTVLYIGIDDSKLREIVNVTINVQKNKLIIKSNSDKTINTIEADQIVDIEFDLSDVKFEFMPPVLRSKSTKYVFYFECNKSCKLINNKNILFKKKIALNIRIIFDNLDNTTVFFKKLFEQIDNLSESRIFDNHEIKFTDKMNYYIKYVETNSHEANTPFFRNPISNIKNSITKSFDIILDTIVLNDFVKFLNTSSNLTDKKYIEKILDLLIEKILNFKSSIGEKITIEQLPENRFINPFVIVISPIFLQGVCSKLAKAIIPKPDDSENIRKLADKCKHIATILMKIVSKFASYKLEYDVNSNNGLVEAVKELNDCVQINNIDCSIYNKILEFLSIFFDSTIIDTFKTNTLNKINELNKIALPDVPKIALPEVPKVSDIINYSTKSTKST